MSSSPTDPRFKNHIFDAQNLQSYFRDYVASLNEALGAVSPEALDAACQLMRKTRQSGARIFVAGNGGSAAISEHLCCDWQKGVHVSGQGPLQVHSLTSNTALLTAVANDFGYDKSFAFQLELADLKSADILVMISSSGNSENIMQAVTYGKEKGCKVIGLTGFNGGKLKAAADVALHIPIQNYGVVEDAHQSLMHILAQYHDLAFRKEKNL